jgi:DNA mismatch repair protein MutL
MPESRIKLLPDHVANQIAAGEVVQRPASVVKELMENSLDAGAQQIKLIVKDGGKSLIQVVDDGMGMNQIDARMAFERHATSKIAKAEDLFQLHTKGFRGEALASIAAVAHIELKTKPEDAELGTYIKIEGSKIITQEPVVMTKGTSVSVKNLFYNIPARRKFLKSIQVEMKHINNEFFRLALAHPGISFTLIHNGNIIYQLPKSNLLQRITNLFGNKLKEKLVPVNEETEYIKISGFIGKPEFAKLKRGEQYFFVNNRFVKSAYLHHALMSAYEGLIKDKSYPSYFVFFDINPKHIDVNIHPTKTEIKFDDEQTVYSILKVAAKHSLGQFNLSPAMDFDSKPELDVPYDWHKKSPKLPEIKVDPDFNPFKENEDDFGLRSKTPARYFEKKMQYWEDLIQNAREQSDEISTQSNHIQQQDFVSIESQINNEAFQYKNKYIITYKGENLLIIHQNRAHQLIRYNELLHQIKSGHIPSQQLIFPVELKLTKQDVQLIRNYDENFNKMGFDIEFNNDETILIKGVPLEQKTAEITGVFDEIIQQLSMDAPVDNLQIEKKLAEIIAVQSAVKTGQKLEQEEILKLISDLFNQKNPMYSPKGKKVFIRLDSGDLDGKFG